MIAHSIPDGEGDAQHLPPTKMRALVFSRATAGVGGTPRDAKLRISVFFTSESSRHP